LQSFLGTTKTGVNSLSWHLENKALNDHEKNIPTFPEKEKKQTWV